MVLIHYKWLLLTLLSLMEDIIMNHILLVKSLLMPQVKNIRMKARKLKPWKDSTAYMITSMLDDTSITGGGAMENVAMKTGTTNFDENYRKKLGMADDAIRDSWVIGYTTKNNNRYVVWL